MVHHRMLLPSIAPPLRADPLPNILNDQVWVRLQAARPLCNVFASACSLMVAGARFLEMRLPSMGLEDMELDFWATYKDGRLKVPKQSLVAGLINGSQEANSMTPQVLSEIQSTLTHLNLLQLVVIRRQLPPKSTAMQGTKPHLAAFAVKVEATISEKLITVMFAQTRREKESSVPLVCASPADIFKTPVRRTKAAETPRRCWQECFSSLDKRRLGYKVVELLGMTVLAKQDFEADAWLFASCERRAAHSASRGPLGVYFQLSTLSADCNIVDDEVITMHHAEMRQFASRPDEMAKWVVLKLPPAGDTKGLEPPSFANVMVQLGQAINERKKRLDVRNRVGIHSGESDCRSDSRETLRRTSAASRGTRAAA